MAMLEFGWRMATFSTDGSPGTLLRDHVAEHLRRLEGQINTVWV